MRQNLLAEAARLGIYFQCADCGRWVSGPESVAASCGPRCRVRAGLRRARRWWCGPDAA
jgi:hypothetical protein